MRGIYIKLTDMIQMWESGERGSKSKSLAGWWTHAGQHCSVFFSLKYLHSDSWRIFKKTSFNFLYAECSAEIVMLTLVWSEVGVIGGKRDRRAGAKSWSHKARWDAIRRIQRRVIAQIREYRGEWFRRSGEYRGEWFRRSENTEEIDCADPRIQKGMTLVESDTKALREYAS